MPQSLASDSVYSGGKLPPTLTPTGHFAGKPTLPISRSVTLIGARKQARLQLISSTVSQNHALIVNADSGAYIRDLASRMGIQVNGRQAPELPLSDGDEIQIGRFTFRFNASPNARPSEAKQEVAAAGRVKVEGADFAVPIDGRSMLIGRRDSCDIHLTEESVSTTHAIIFEMDGRRYIRDLASRTGTFVNGKQIHQVELMPSDEIRIGESAMQYIADASPGVTQEEIVPTDLAAEPADLELEPAAEAPPPPPVDEISLETEEPAEEVAPPPIPMRRPPRPMPAAPVADVNAAAAEALELVHDQPEELEPVELAPVELEAPQIPAEPIQEAPPAVEEEVEIEPLAPALAHRAEEEDIDLAPIEVGGEIGGGGFEGLQEIRVAPEEPPEPSESEAAVPPPPVEETPVAEAAAPAPAEVEIDISPEESFELEAVEPPVPVAEPAPVTPVTPPPIEVAEPAPVMPVNEEPAEFEWPPLEIEPAEAAVEQVAPLAEVQPPVAPPPPRLAPPSPPKLVQRPKPAPEPPVDKPVKPKKALKPAKPLKPAAKAAEAILPLDAFAVPVEETELPSLPEIQIDEEVPALKFDDAQIEALEEEIGMSPRLAEMATPSMKAPEAAAAGLDFGEVEELPESVFTAALDDTAYEVPALDLGEGVEEAATEEIPEAELDLGLEEPAIEEPVAEGEEESVVEEELAAEEPTAEEAEAGETIAAVEATPESAQALDEVIEEAPAPQEVDQVEEVELTDSTFGREVSEFTADSTGPIVDEAPAPAAEDEVAEREIAPAAEVPPLPPAPPSRFGPGASQLHLEPLEERPPARPLPDIEPVEAVHEDLLPEMEQAPPPPVAKRERLFDLEPIESPVPAAKDEEITITPTEEGIEPVEVEPIEVEAVEALPQDSTIELEPIEAGSQAIEDLPAVASAGEDTLGEADIEMALEPADIAPEPAPVVPSPRPAPPVPISETPITETPRLTPPPDEAKPRTKLDEFNWGANQEHFFGGMPLRLTPQQQPQAPLHRPAPPAAPMAPAARVPQEFEPPPSAPPQAPTPQPVAPRPAARKPVAPQPRPMQTQAGAKTPKRPPVTTGFDGLAVPAGGDVFAQTPGSLTAGFAPGLMDDVFAGGGRIGPAAEIPPTQPPPADGGAAAGGAARPRRASKADPMGDAWAPVTPPQVEPPAPQRPPQPGASHPGLPPQMPSAPPPQRKKRRWFGLRMLILLMVMFSAAAAAGVFAFLPVNSAVTATLKYENFKSLPETKRRAVAAEQVKLLESDEVRRAAADQVRARIKPEFLSDFLAYTRAIQSRQFDPQNGVLTINYTGRKAGAVVWPAAGETDRQRFSAIVQAMYDANRRNIDDAEKAKNTVESLTAAVAQTTRDIDEKKKQIDDLAAASERPDATQRTAIENEAAQLSKAQSEALATIDRLTAELAALQNNPAAVATNDPKAISIPPPPEDDAELSTLQAELKDLEGKIAAARSAQSDKGKAARMQLDAALEAFNKSIASAQAAGNNNPDLLTYLNAADKLLKSSRELTDGLIARQEKQSAELTDLKVRLNDKLLARRAELWKKDPELLKLMDQRDIQTRRYNAAIGQGMTKEAGDIKTDLNYIESAIKARQTIVADDGFYADAIDQLQRIIEATQKGLEQDRAHTLAALDEMQSTFTKGAPATLTPEQKRIAEEIDQRLSAVTAARKQYTLDADAASQQTDQEIRALQISASQVTSKVAARKEQLAAANPVTAKPPAPAPSQPSAEETNRAIQTKTAELAAAKKSADEIKTAFAAASAKLADLNKRVESARTAGQQRDKIIGARDSLQQELVNRTNQLEEKKQQLAAAVYPVKPTDENVKFNGETDQRPKYAMVAAGGMVFIFMVWIGLTTFASRGEAAEQEQPQYAPAEGYETAGGNGEIAVEDSESADRGAPVEA